tara:strand:- start:365 stop:2881 length:2517 start_codon:yes stop_codon:yes gene_type:complete
MVILCNKPFTENVEYQKHFKLFPSIELSDFQKWSFKAIVEKQHILVTAHTGSGKTLPAEFAIKHFVEQGKKVIYTSPIKALSNTKLSDLRKKYPTISFGIITGDVTDNPEADVLIMTTEILPNTLSNRKLRKETGNTNVPLSFEMDIDNELAAVVFDEVHYINDRERGCVWEQAIMMLPPQVQLIMLSATIDKPHYFAKWVEDVKAKQAIEVEQPPKNVYLAPTNHRVVPLTHYLWFASHKSTIKAAKGTKYEFKMSEYSNKGIVVKDERGVFDENNYHIIADLTKYNRSLKKTRESRQHILNCLIRHLKDTKGLPAICFVFSKKQTETAAKEIGFSLFEKDSTIPNTIEDDCKKILIAKLPNYKEYTLLPEYHDLMVLLKKGIGIHHAGVLAVFREMIEILFEQKKLRLLFATETLAVGINFSTTSVIFTGISKYDGHSRRTLEPHEYTQISGRAGRRGIDKVGKVWLCANLFDMDSVSEFKRMLTGAPQALVSKFRFSFTLCLHLIGTESADSFCEFGNKSFMMNDIENEIRTCKIKIDEINKSLSTKKMYLATSGINIDELRNYQTKKNIVTTSSNRKRKVLSREISTFESENPSFRKNIQYLDDINNHENELIKVENYKNNAEEFIVVSVERVTTMIEELGFVVNNNGKRELNLMGTIGSQFKEIHPLASTLLMIESNYFHEMDSAHLCGLFACFTDIVVADELKLHVPSTTSVYLNKITSRLDKIMNEIYDLELLYNIDTGTSYERSFDIQQYVLDWAKATSEQECREVLDTLKTESGIFLGQFVKSILKVNTVCKEFERAAEVTQNLELLEKLRKIPDLTLKYVATNQSLYV